MPKFFMLLWMLLPFLAIGQQTEQGSLRTKNFNLEDKLAIQGYDPIAYFSKAAQMGKKEFATQYQGVTYWFVSKENKERFLASPAKYEPAYGGWCAYAMGATGERVSINPDTYKIIDGKLYLFYNKFFTNTLNSWNKDETALKRKADQAWSQQFK